MPRNFCFRNYYKYFKKSLGANKNNKKNSENLFRKHDFWKTIN